MVVVPPRLSLTSTSKCGFWPLIRSMYFIGARAAPGSGDDQTRQLVPIPRRSTEHLGVAAHSYIARTEIILEAAINALSGAALVVTHLLGKYVAGGAPGQRLGGNRFFAARHGAGMRLDDRHVTKPKTLGLERCEPVSLPKFLTSATATRKIATTNTVR